MCWDIWESLFIGWGERYMTGTRSPTLLLTRSYFLTFEPAPSPSHFHSSPSLSKWLLGVGRKEGKCIRLETSGVSKSTLIEYNGEKWEEGEETGLLASADPNKRDKVSSSWFVGKREKLMFRRPVSLKPRFPNSPSSAPPGFDVWGVLKTIFNLWREIV